MARFYAAICVFSFNDLPALCRVVYVTSCSVISLCVNVWRVNVLFNKVGVTNCSGDE